MILNLKKSLFLFFAICLFNLTYGQTDFYSEIKNYDLTQVFQPDSVADASNVKIKLEQPLGFIDPAYRRLQVHYTSIKKSDTNPYEYDVIGKTKVGEAICSFKGIFKVISAVTTNDKETGASHFKQITIKTEVTVFENKDEAYSGFFKGILTSDAYITKKGELLYNALQLMSERYANNQFDGKWTSYKNNKSKKCSWGDFRIPTCGDLDVGEDEFGVNPKYLKNGWQNYKIANSGSDSKEAMKARKKEDERWWE